ncbi:hypothetical protein CLIB1444_05S04104 [[Candida] jaroonii]|uniref:Uncharacterized protein n=1 Tax=[Candida] jaroonii TaxID=467808 RepID=A0ACA9Y8E2_9ASCO|nr:hypothetical protein CLIB1444_05S04104 [[Candida] jaroonii]
MNYSVKLRSGDSIHSTLSNRPSVKGKFSKIFLLLHGFPDNNESFQELAKILDKNYPKALILSPLMRGYEPSSYHKFNEYKPSDLAEDVHNWVEALGRPVTLIGHDWGAIASFKAASMYPDDFESVITMAIPYLSNLHLHDLLFYAPEQFYYSSYFLTMQSSYFYGKLRQLGSKSYLNKLWEYWSPSYQFDDDIEPVRKTLLFEDTIDHVTAYYRCVMNPLNIRHIRGHIDFDKVPTLIMGGREDQCMTVRLFELEERKLQKFPNAKVEIVDGVGHFLHRENPKLIGDLILDWLKEH